MKALSRTADGTLIVDLLCCFFHAARGVRQELAILSKQVADGSDVLYGGVDNENAKNPAAFGCANFGYGHGYDSPMLTIGTRPYGREGSRANQGEIRWRPDAKTVVRRGPGLLLSWR